MRELGVWRSWLAHLVWDQRVLCSSHSTPTFNKNLLKISRFFFFLRGGNLDITFVFTDKSSQIVTFVREIRHFSEQTDQFEHSIREKSDFHGQRGASKKEYPPVLEI